MKKKILAFCLVLMLIITALPVIAFATTTATVKTDTAGGSLNLRAGPGTNHEVLGYVQDGESITVNFQGSEWSNITNKSGKTGYIKNKYITAKTESDSSITWGTGTYYVYVSPNGGSLVIRAGESTSSAINGYVQHGDAVTLISQGTEWSKITAVKSGKSGYIKTKYLRTNPSSTTSSEPVSASDYSAAVVMTKTVGGQVNIRTGAGTSNSSIGTVGRGTFLKVTGTSGDWAKVTLNNGKSGYIHKDYVSYGVKATTTANRLNLRKGAGTSYGIISVLNKGTSIIVNSVTGNWAKVTIGSKSGYVSLKYIQY